MGVSPMRRVLWHGRLAHAHTPQAKSTGETPVPRMAETAMPHNGTIRHDRRQVQQRASAAVAP